MRSYTDTQVQWMKEVSQKPRYRTQSGKLRLKRLSRAFESKFGEKRSMGAFGHKMRDVVENRAHRPMKRATERQLNKIGSLTAMESAARTIIAMVEKIRTTMM